MPTNDSYAVLLGETQRSLRAAIELTLDQVVALMSEKLSPEVQCAALAGLLLRNSLTEYERDATISLAKLHPDVALVFNRTDLLDGHHNKNEPASSLDCWQSVFKALLEKNTIGKDGLSVIVSKISSNVELRHVSALLMTICVRGMQTSDVACLTDLMANSGELFDYRNEKSLRGARLVRRYPTGALSEKVALILPALIACAREYVNVYTPFLVARSLGYTGGTWDKLNAVAGFIFPEPGEDSIATLLKCGVAMTVTKGAANPADRVLYQLRSLTGTIESVPLIVSSIASKQICFPVHRLLMDVRYGNGAFLDDIADAKILGEELQSILCAEGVPTFYTLTDTEQPSGSAVGNALEVAEAIAVMGGCGSTLWDLRSLEIQRRYTIDFFAKLMNSEFPIRSLSEWATYADNQFKSGAILKSFANILLAHKVPRNVVEDTLKNPFNTLGISHTPVDILAHSSGTLIKINQRKLGEIINRNLNAGRNDVEGKYDPTVGVIILHRLGDKICKGAVLCKTFSDSLKVEHLSEDLRECFVLDTW
jgi:thymidine phosphorylase